MIVLRRLIAFALVVCVVFAAHPRPIRATDPPLDLNFYTSSIRPGFERDLLAQIDAPRYLIDMTIDPDARVVTGTERVRYANRDASPLNEIVLRLYPNTGYMGGSMHVSDVRVDGKPVRIEPYRPGEFADGSAMRVLLVAPLLPRQALELRLSYTITAPLEPKSGYTTFGMIDGILALPNAYAMIAPRSNGRWLADPAPGFGDIVQSELALYRVVVHAPSDFVLVPGGVCEAAGGGAMQVMTCVAAPARDFAVHLSRYYRQQQTNVSDDRSDAIVVRSYFTALHQRAGESALTIVAEALRNFERRFGPYPYREFTVFESQSVAGGIEYPLSVGVNYGLYQQDGGYMEWVTAHEVAHQWWYGLVGSDPVREPWLDESMAQYSASLYIEERYGKAAADAERQRFFTDRYAAETKERGDTKAAQPTGAFYRWTYAPIVYGKAPLFFQDVRDAVGDARFGRWLRMYFERQRFDFAHAPDLLAAADEAGIGPAVREAYARRILGR